MKKLFLFLIIILAGVCRAKAQDGWIDCKIDDKLSVKFPKQPPSMGDENMITVKDDDSTVYAIAVVDAKTDDVDSATLASHSSTKEFADSFKNGLLGGMPGSKLGDVTIGRWNDYTSYTANGGNVAKKFKLYVFMILKGTKMYALFTVVPESNDTKGKDYFFSSLRLLSEDSAQDQINWIKYKMDERVSLKFPQKPADLNKSTLYAKDADTSIYTFSIVDFTKRPQGADSVQITTEASTAAFESHFKQQITDQLPGSYLGDVIIGNWNGHLSYSIEGGYPPKKKKIYVFVVFFGTEAYALTAIVSENVEVTGKDYFFGSFTLN